MKVVSATLRKFSFNSLLQCPTPSLVVIKESNIELSQQQRYIKALKNVLKYEFLKNPPSLSSIFFLKPGCMLGYSINFLWGGVDTFVILMKLQKFCYTVSRSSSIMGLGGDGSKMKTKINSLLREVLMRTTSTCDFPVQKITLLILKHNKLG